MCVGTKQHYISRHKDHITNTHTHLVETCNLWLWGVWPQKTLASTSVLKATCLEYEHGEEDVFIEVVGLFITGATLVRVWVNVSNVQ